MMVGFLISAIKIALNAIVTFFSGIVGEWMRIQSSRKRGKAEAQNEAHEENAKRRKKSDDILQKPIKTGKSLTDNIRKRSKSKSSGK